MHDSGAWPEAVDPVADHAEGAHLRSDRRNRRGADDLVPRTLGGVRNWDYRYCWLRDAAFTLLALMPARLPRRGAAWSHWLVRPLAGDPTQAADHVRGRRRAASDRDRARRGCPATRARSRSGSATRRPISSNSTSTARSSNSIHHAQTGWPEDNGDAWALTRSLVDVVEDELAAPRRGDLGGPRRAPALRQLEGHVLGRRRPCAPRRGGFRSRLLRSPAGGRCATRSLAEILTEGYDADRGTFTQSYGSTELDASAASDAARGLSPSRPTSACSARSRRSSVSSAMTGWFIATRRPASTDPSTGFPRARAPSSPAASGLSPIYALLGPHGRGASALRAAAVASKRRRPPGRGVRLRTQRQVGNFPQAFSHVPLIMAAHLLGETAEKGTGWARRDRQTAPRRAGTAALGSSTAMSAAATTERAGLTLQ